MDPVLEYMLRSIYGDEEVDAVHSNHDLAHEGDEFARRVAGHLAAFRARLFVDDADFPLDLADELTRDFAHSLLWPESGPGCDCDDDESESEG